MKYKIICKCFFLIVCMALLSSCGSNLSNKDDKLELGQLAYDQHPGEDNVVYVPYIVITSNYGGNVLLLRQYILDEYLPYQENALYGWGYNEYGGYYEHSNIDDYLENEFINLLSYEVQQKIESTDIVITDKSSQGVTGEKTDVIKRRVFLLSLHELNGPKSRASVEEGSILRYFKDDFKRRYATNAEGEKYPYWTRTPETWETYTVFTIGESGVGVGSADVSSGVRPAFCMSYTTKVQKRAGIVKNRLVYVLD